MDAKLKAEWVKALRSGGHEQCRDELSDGIGGTCCIGVGYRVLGFDPDDLSGEDDPTYLAASSIGLDSDARDALIKLNDGTAAEPGKSFPEIADYIEANL